MRRRWAILLALAAVVGLLFLETERGRAREPAPRRAAPRDVGDARLASAPAEEGAEIPAGAIAGIVRDERGLPLPGARVRLFPDRVGGAADAWRDRAPDAPSPRATATTDDEGRFALTAGQGTPWILMADAPERVPAVRLVPRGQDTAHLVLVRGETQELRVVDEEKRPLAGAEALVFQGGATLRACAKADALGRIAVVFAPRDLLLVRAPGFTWELLEPPLADPEIVLDREYRLGGVVVKATGEPASGVAVTLERYLWLDRQLTSEDGSFLFPGLAPAEVELQIEMPDGEWTTETAQTGDERLRIVLPTVRIEGTVVLPDGTPAAGAQVVSPAYVKCDDRGRFSIGQLRPGAISVGATLGEEYGGYRYLTLPAAGLTGIRVVLEPVAVVRSFVSVRVVGPDAARARVTARTDDGKDRTGRWERGAEGRGTLAVDAPPGTAVTLRAWATEPGEKRPVPWIGTARAVTGASPAGPEIVLPLRRPVEVTVVCRAIDGSALPDGVETEASCRERSSKELPAPGPGRHRFLVPCDPDPVTLSATAPGYVYESTRWSPTEGEGEVEIRLKRAARITGRFVAEIDWISAGGRMSRSEDGSFVLEATPGETTILVAGKGPVPGISRTIEVPLRGDLDLGDLALEAPFVAKGVVLDEGGTPVGGAQVTATGDYGAWKVTTRGDGSFAILLPRSDLFHVEVEKDRLAAPPIPVAAFLRGPQTIRLAPPGR